MTTTTDTTATVLTENGYALCARHVAAWEKRGWNGAYYTFADPADVAYEITGRRSLITCADCDQGSASS